MQQLTVEREKGTVMQLKLKLKCADNWNFSFTGPGSQFVIKVVAWDGKMLGLPGAVHAVTDIGIHSCAT